MPKLFKSLKLFVLLFVFSLSAFGQNNFFTPDAKKDSAWVKQSLIKANKPVIHKDTNQITHKWVSGKVVYSSDGSLRARQLINSPDNFTTTIQYSYHNKILEQNLDYSDISNYSINKIYLLPGKNLTYLFLLSETESQPDYEQNWLNNFKAPNLLNDTDYNHIKTITYAAVVLTFKKDSLIELPFPRIILDNDDGQVANNDDSNTDSSSITAATDTNSFVFTANIKQFKKLLKPFLRYDTLAHTLSFLNTYYTQDDDNPNYTPLALNVESGTYQYKDTAFVISNDTSYYYPSLKSLADTVARRNYKAGKYLIKAKAIEGYEVGYGGIIWPNLTEEYKIGTQTLTDFNNDEWDKIYLKPGYHLQNNSSIILLLEDQTNGHGPGMCGSGSHYDSYFYSVNNKSSKLLFSFSSSTCNFEVNYTFTQNSKDIAGNFYVDDSSDIDNIEINNSYWENNSTYVFVVSSTEDSSARNFYLHFNMLNKKSPVILKAGKLYNKKP